MSLNLFSNSIIYYKNVQNYENDQKNTTLDFENKEDSSSDSDFVENDTIVKPKKISSEKSKSISVEKSKSKSIQQPIQSD